VPRDWDTVKIQRAELDQRIVNWVNSLTDDDIARSITWIRGDVPVETNFGFNLAHMINHQTHHRGQVHAMLTMAGAVPDATDLQMLLVRESASTL